MSLESPTVEELADLTPKQKSELIERVAGSAHFRRAIRLREFLLYVGKGSSRGETADFREQDIGIQVFGRSPDYDRGADNIVRVNATELRKRIDHYFASEGVGEPYVFQIPRGAYKLVFSRRMTEEPVVHPPVPREQEGRSLALPQASTSKGWMWLSLALGVLCLVLGIALVRSRSSAGDAGGRPGVMQFWRAFTRANEPGAQTDLVLSDESLSLMQDILRRPVSLSEYVDRSYVNTIDTAPVSSERKADIHELLGHNLVTLGSVLAARQIIALPGLAEHFHVTVPRLYPPDLMKRNNLIVVGGKKSNPWAGFFDDQLTFTLESNTATGQNFVLNRHPTNGEAAEYHGDRSSSVLPGGIAVVAYIPNPSNTGEVLLLTGSDSDATAAAAEFITSESSLQHLLMQSGRNQLPHFELVLRTTRLNGTSFTSEIVASRIHS